MPTWSEILKELLTQNNNGIPLDQTRRKYLAKTSVESGRDVILYATAWTQKPDTPSNLLSIVDEDIQGLMEVVYGLKNPNLDLILHSPGGSAEAAEAIVEYLRSKFDHIRVIVPQQAMSAATMISCCADIIVMGKHSFLGPIDPQMVIQTQLGNQMAPAQAILEQFEQAKIECSDPKKMAAWLPMLGQYGPHLLVRCKNVSKMAEDLVSKWLRKYMFKEDEKGKEKAGLVAKWLADHKHFKSHGRHIARSEVVSRGLEVEPLEEDQNFQDNILSVFHSTTHTFSMTPAVKIIENHLGRAFIKQSQAIPVIQPQSVQPKPVQPAKK